MGDARLLALAVLRQAMQDAVNRSGRRHSAREWLTSDANPTRQFWSLVAGVPDDVVVATAQRALGVDRQAA